RVWSAICLTRPSLSIRSTSTSAAPKRNWDGLLSTRWKAGVQVSMNRCAASIAHSLPDMTPPDRDPTDPLSRDVVHSSESPEASVLRMIGGFAMTQVVHTSAKTGIPDRLVDHACAAADIATELGLHPEALE